MLKRIVTTLSAVAMLASSASAQQIVSPDAAYLAATTRLEMPDEFTTFSSLSSGAFTVNFSTDGESRLVGSSWSTWDVAPETEWDGVSPYRVGFAQGATSLTMSFNSLVSIFGFEAQPNPFQVLGMTAQFYRGLDLVGTVTRDVDGDAGARLFAYEVAGGIDRVEFSSDEDFAVASLRFGGLATSVPEPASLALMGLGLVGLVTTARRRRA